jgi:hypothetical protein
LAGQSNTIQQTINGTLNRSVIIGGQSNTITNSSDSIAAGASASVAHDNCFVWSDGAATTTTTGIRQFIVGAAGGSTFYSNTARTTGVTLAAGASSWSAVSDRNLKENIFPLDHQNTLSNMANIEVYKYNFIGNSPDQICYGPMAQEWNPIFGCPMKDPLMIDQGDILGILLSSVKGLYKRIQNIDERIQS